MAVNKTKSETYMQEAIMTIDELLESIAMRVTEELTAPVNLLLEGVSPENNERAQHLYNMFQLKIQTKMNDILDELSDEDTFNSDEQSILDIDVEEVEDDITMRLTNAYSRIIPDYINYFKKICPNINEQEEVMEEEEVTPDIEEIEDEEIKDEPDIEDEDEDIEDEEIEDEEIEDEDIEETDETEVITFDEFFDSIKDAEYELLFESAEDDEELDITGDEERAFIVTVYAIYNIATPDFNVQFLVPYWVSYNEGKTNMQLEYNSELRMRSTVCIKKKGNKTIDGLELKYFEYYIIEEGQNMDEKLYFKLLEKFLSEYKPALYLTDEEEEKCITYLSELKTTDNKDEKNQNRK